jgi:integrase
MPIESFRDFIRQFIKLNEKNYSKGRIGCYKVLIRNIELYLEEVKTTDLFHSMSRDRQMVWFSEYVDFLLHKEIPNVKAKYENVSAYQNMSMIKSVCSSFMDTGVKITPMFFVRNLRRVDSEAMFCTKDNVMQIIKAWETSRGTEWKAASLFLFQAVTGLRFGELKTVTDQALDANNRLTFISDKKGVSNQVPLGNLACRILNAWADRKIIENVRSNYALPIMSSTHANAALHEFLKKISSFQGTTIRVRYRGNEKISEIVPIWKAITTHSARHTYSHLMAEGGLEISETSSLLSHRSIGTTNKYYKHFDKDRIQKKALDIINSL